MDDNTLREAIRRSVAHAEPKRALIGRIEELEANINLKADFIDATINQLAASDQRIEELEAKLAKAVDALDEAVYLLRPDEKDMMRQAGVYRIVTALAELKGQKDE